MLIFLVISNYNVVLIEYVLESWKVNRQKLEVVSGGISEAIVKGFIQKYCLKQISHQDL